MIAPAKKRAACQIVNLYRPSATANPSKVPSLAAMTAFRSICPAAASLMRHCAPVALFGQRLAARKPVINLRYRQ
jgi:hypothetical protein